MTAGTSEILAQALENAGLNDMASMARLDHYHEFKSDVALPEMELERDLRQARDECPDPEGRARIEAIRQRLLNGDFDASYEESEEWTQSEEGRGVFDKLIKGE